MRTLSHRAQGPLVLVLVVPRTPKSGHEIYGIDTALTFQMLPK